MSCIVYSPAAKSTIGTRHSPIRVELNATGVDTWTAFLHTERNLVASGAVELYGSTYVVKAFPERKENETLFTVDAKYALFTEEVTYLDRDGFRFVDGNGVVYP